MTTEAKRETGHEMDLDSPDSRTSNSTMERLAAALQRAQGGAVAEMRALGELYASDAAAIRELVEAAEAVESWASTLYTVLTEWDLNGEKPDPVEALKLKAVWDDVARLRTALQRVRSPR